MGLRFERSDAASRRPLHAIVVAERSLSGPRSGDLDELERNPGVGHQPFVRGGRLPAIGVGGAEILGQRGDLRGDLLVGDVLFVGVEDDVDHRPDGDDLRLLDVEHRLAAPGDLAFEAHLIGAKRGEAFEQHHVRGHRAARSPQLLAGPLALSLGHRSSRTVACSRVVALAARVLDDVRCIMRIVRRTRQRQSIRAARGRAGRAFPAS